MDNFTYNKQTTHKAIFFGPGVGGTGRRRPKTSLCKLVYRSHECYEYLDEEICKRNWKSVECSVCKEIAGK